MTAKQDTTVRKTPSQPAEDQLAFADAEQILAKVKVANELKKLNLGDSTNQEVVNLLKQLTKTVSALSHEKAERFRAPSLVPINDLLFVSSIDFNAATVLIAEFGVATKVVASVIDKSRPARNRHPAQVSTLNDIITPQLICWNRGAVGRDTLPANFRGIIFPKSAEIKTETNPEQIDQNHHLIRELGIVATSDVLGGDPRTDISAYCRAFFIGKDIKGNNKYIDALRHSMQEKGGYTLEQDTIDITETFSRSNSQIEIFDNYPHLKIFQFTGIREQH